MEVKLQSEVRRPVNRSGMVGLVLVLCVAIGFLLLTMQDWYFPKPTSWWLVVPASVPGIWLAIAIARVPSRQRHGRVRGIFGDLAVLMLLPFIMCLGFAVGAPALWLRWQGPQTTVIDRIQYHEQGSRSCPWKIGLARHANRFNARLCVSREDFERLTRGQEVWVSVREGYFGVLAFSMQPAGAGPE